MISKVCILQVTHVVHTRYGYEHRRITYEPHPRSLCGASLQTARDAASRRRKLKIDDLCVTFAVGSGAVRERFHASHPGLCRQRTSARFPRGAIVRRCPPMISPMFDAALRRCVFGALSRRVRSVAVMVVATASPVTTRQYEQIRPRDATATIADLRRLTGNFHEVSRQDAAA